MRAFLVAAVFLVLAHSVLAQAMNDGPYTRYENKTGITTWVKDSTAFTHIFKQRKKKKQVIKVLAGACMADSFTVKLQRNIATQPVTYPAVSKLLLISDIEGEYCAFIPFMKACGVINEKKEWIFGDGHLVICGDLFDRGKEVTAYLWFLYKLEQEAKTKGGYVHVILGNHDVMNLSGDLRYVDPQYFTAAKLMGVEYASLYGPDTELGKWLRSKNIIEKIGDLLCMHAGISPQVNARKLSVENINEYCRRWYDKPRKSIPDSLQLFFGNESPFWYRGYFTGTKASMDQVNETLTLYGCRQIIVGHTIVDSIGPLYEGKVIGVDVNHHQGNHQALLIEAGKQYRVSSDGTKKDLLF